MPEVYATVDSRKLEYRPGTIYAVLFSHSCLGISGPSDSKILASTARAYRLIGGPPKTCAIEWMPSSKVLRLPSPRFPSWVVYRSHIPAPPSYSLRYPKYHLILAIRPLTELCQEV